MTTSQIPEKAIEAAARVGINNYSDARPNVHPKIARWEDYDEDDRAEVLRQVREELEAAAPFLKAQALREYADELYRDTPSSGPERVRRYLRVQGLRLRADDLEAQA